MTATIDFDAISSPIIFRGDERTAYRDPAAIFHDGCFHLFFTLATITEDGGVFLRIAKSTSRDLISWTTPRILTPADNSLNYSSPGNIIRFRDRWVLCLQTYPRPNGEKWGNESSRLWTMSSDDLENWESPRLLRVSGPDIPREKMGRMIDPFLVQDRQDPGKWWCFYKQNGASMSWSRDLENWTPFGRIEAGENCCVIQNEDGYTLFHSPDNGIGVKHSTDLVHWTDKETFYLGQAGWPWAQGRLTAGFVLDLRAEPSCGRALLFFHGSGPENEDVYFDNHASLGLAWSDTLTDWKFANSKD